MTWACQLPCREGIFAAGKIPQSSHLTFLTGCQTSFQQTLHPNLICSLAGRSSTGTKIYVPSSPAIYHFCCTTLPSIRQAVNQSRHMLKQFEDTSQGNIVNARTCCQTSFQHTLPSVVRCCLSALRLHLQPALSLSWADWFDRMGAERLLRL